MAIDLPEDVPDAVRDTWENFGGLHVPELGGQMTKAAQAIYKQGSRGKCMTCGRKVGSEAICVVTVQGVNQLYCSHRCNQDINVVGWLQQMHDDIREGIDFRGRGSH